MFPFKLWLNAWTAVLIFERAASKRLHGFASLMTFTRSASRPSCCRHQAISSPIPVPSFDSFKYITNTPSNPTPLHSPNPCNHSFPPPRFPHSALHIPLLTSPPPTRPNPKPHFPYSHPPSSPHGLQGFEGTQISSAAAGLVGSTTVGVIWLGALFIDVNRSDGRDEKVGGEGEMAGWFNRIVPFF